MTAIKERPILFSAPMVRAILENRKTVTRRIVKSQYLDGQWSVRPTESPRHERHSHDWWLPTGSQPYAALPPCPYGQVGDRLWVREAWQADAQLDAVAPREMSQGEPIRYPADEAVRQTGCAMISPGKIRPSIHMPRWVSRILLEITDVRVERLKDISDEQAQAEGCFFTDYGKRCFHGGNGWNDAGDCPAVVGHQQREGWMWDKTTSHEQCLGSARHAFGNLWNKVNGPDAWDSNPWVWVVEFKRVMP